MFSIDPWNHAVELANRLYKAGYEYSEVRGGIHKGTYKVFANMWPVADITYLPKDEFDKLKTKKHNGINIISEPKVMADILRQLTSVNDVYRWDKVYTREKLYKKWNQPLGKKFSCNEDIFMGGKKEIPMEYLTLLEKCRNFIDSKKLLYYGSLAYNIYVSIGGGTQRLLVDQYEVMSENAKEDIDKLFDLLVKEGVKSELINIRSLNIDVRHQTSRAGNNSSYIISYASKPICTITQLTNCIGYKYLNNKYIVGVDFIKWMLYTDLAFANSKDSTILKCKIKYLLEIQNNYYKSKNIDELENSPFQRLIINCKGPLDEGIKVNFLNKYIDRVEGRREAKVIKPQKDNIILKNVKGSTIRIFPKTIKNNECNKSKEDCKYPCNWNNDRNKCYPIPEGIYRVGDPVIESIDEISNDKDLYPSYGI